MIKILIADDHAVVRAGLVQLFALAGDVTVVGQAVNGAQVLDFVRQGQCDLVLLDMTMPGICGTDLIARLRTHAPALPLLVLSMHNEAPIARRALKAGATGYVTKDGDPEILLAAVRKLAAGGRYIDPALAQQMAFETDTGLHLLAHEQLSNRELDILTLLVGGMSVNDIADKLSISNKTVSTHKARLMQKMGFQSNAEMLRYGMDHGLGS